MARGLADRTRAARSPERPGILRIWQDFTQISPACKVAEARLSWLTDLRTGFKRHRQGRPGWFPELMVERLRVVSDELPPRPDQPPGSHANHNSGNPGTLSRPGELGAALNHTNAIFDAVMAFRSLALMPSAGIVLPPCSPLESLRCGLASPAPAAGHCGERIQRRSLIDAGAPYLSPPQVFASQQARPMQPP